MAKHVLKNPRVFYQDLSLTGLVDLSWEVNDNPQDSTDNFSTAQDVEAGIPSATVGIGGFWDAGTDTIDALVAASRKADKILTASAEGASDGDVAYLLSAMIANYKPLDGATVGQMHKFALSLSSVGTDMVRATLMVDNSAALTASGAGTARQLGAVSATQKVWATLHVLAASGSSPTLDVDIESDATNSFSGAETVRASFTQATARGAEIISASGAITDTWWRLAWTIGGGTPSFTAVGAIGIQ